MDISQRVQRIKNWLEKLCWKYQIFILVHDRRKQIICGVVIEGLETSIKAIAPCITATSHVCTENARKSLPCNSEVSDKIMLYPLCVQQLYSVMLY